MKKAGVAIQLNMIIKCQISMIYWKNVKGTTTAHPTGSWFHKQLAMNVYCAFMPKEIAYDLLLMNYDNVYFTVLILKHVLDGCKSA